MRKVAGLLLFVVVLASGAIALGAAACGETFRAHLIRTVVFPLLGAKAQMQNQSVYAAETKVLREAGDILPSPALRREFVVTSRLEGGFPVVAITPRTALRGETILYLHGGAFVAPMSRWQWQLVAGLARRTSARVIVPLYPLAPEYGYESAFAMLRTVYAHLLANFPGVPISLCGDSAGGGLALSFAQSLRDAGEPLPVDLVLFSPWLNLVLDNPRQTALEKSDPMLSRPGLAYGALAWARGASLEEPRLSPLFGSLRGLPPMLIFSGTADLLNADARELAEKAAAASVPMILVEGRNMTHAWSILPIPEAEALYDRAAAFMDARLSALCSDAHINPCGVAQRDQFAAQISPQSLADKFSFRRNGFLLQLLPLLPESFTLAAIRNAQSAEPDLQQVGALKVDRAKEGAVSVIWFARAQRSRGVIVYLHGGAYIGGPAREQWAWLAEVARRSHLAAVAVLYRMPPDHPFPAALNDATDAISWMEKSGDLVTGKWILAGDSAGGGLAIATEKSLADLGQPKAAGLVLMSPWVDLSLQNPKLEDSKWTDPVLGKGWLSLSAHLYAQNVSLSDPRVSPLNTSFRGFPPVHLSVGTRDLLSPDVHLLRDKLRAAGVPVDYLEQQGGVHTFPLYLATAEAQNAIASQASWILQRLIDGPLNLASTWQATDTQ